MQVSLNCADFSSYTCSLVLKQGTIAVVLDGKIMDSLGTMWKLKVQYTPKPQCACKAIMTFKCRIILTHNAEEEWKHKGNQLVLLYLFLFFSLMTWSIFLHLVVMVVRITVLLKFDNTTPSVPPPDSGNMSQRQLWGFMSKSTGAVCFPFAVPLALSSFVSRTFLSTLTLAPSVAGQRKTTKK